jgi:7-keto-8-aminopelargonate synthetase-like enzyme
MSWEIVPIVAIVMGIGCGMLGIVSGILRTFLRHRAEMAAFQAKTRPDSVAGLDEVVKLRNEFAQLRDTTTQYDMSIQYTLDELRQRIEFLESQRHEAVIKRQTMPTEEPLQQILAGRPKPD